MCVYYLGRDDRELWALPAGHLPQGGQHKQVEGYGGRDGVACSTPGVGTRRVS